MFSFFLYCGRQAGRDRAERDDYQRVMSEGWEEVPPVREVDMRVSGREGRVGKTGLGGGRQVGGQGSTG